MQRMFLSKPCILVLPVQIYAQKRPDCYNNFLRSWKTAISRPLFLTALAGFRLEIKYAIEGLKQEQERLRQEENKQEKIRAEQKKREIKRKKDRIARGHRRDKKNLPGLLEKARKPFEEKNWSLDALDEAHSSGAKVLSILGKLPERYTGDMDVEKLKQEMIEIVEVVTNVQETASRFILAKKYLSQGDIESSQSFFQNAKDGLRILQALSLLQGNSVYEIIGTDEAEITRLEKDLSEQYYCWQFIKDRDDRLGEIRDEVQTITRNFGYYLRDGMRVLQEIRNFSPTDVELEHGEGHERQEHAQRQGRENIGQQFEKRLSRELHSALETDGQQQQDADEIIDRGGQPKLGSGQSGSETQQKEQDDRIHGSAPPGDRHDSSPPVVM